MLNFVICDDNLDMLNKLVTMFEKVFLKNDLPAQISFKSTDVNDLLDYIKDNRIDVLVLDIKLNSKLNGLDVAKQVRKRNKDCYIIFTTGHYEYVLVAYQCKTFDYLCKPITIERLEETITRLFEDINGAKSNNKYIKLDNKNTIINQDEVRYIKRDGMKVIFHTNSRDYEVYSSFAKLQDQLPKNFVRCHKSFIANVNNITKLEPSSNLIYFDNNTTCDIGPKYKEAIMKGVGFYGSVK